jgi:hypothetical protein
MRSLQYWFHLLVNKLLYYKYKKQYAHNYQYKLNLYYVSLNITQIEMFKTQL